MLYGDLEPMMEISAATDRLPCQLTMGPVHPKGHNPNASARISRAESNTENSSMK
jgi:hypothetical protein